MATAKKNLMTRPKTSQGGKGFKGALSSAETPKKQLTLKIDEDLHRKIKLVAVERGTTITDLISGFIKKL